MPVIKLLILDVDGVLTGGELTYDERGCLTKTFHVQDGGAIRSWQKAGGRVAIISGRTSAAVAERARELQIDLVAQGVGDKLPVFEKFCREAGVSAAEASFVGDDLLDIPPMRRCGYPIAVANAVPAVKREARYVTERRGGAGAIGEVVRRLLRHNATRDKCC
ncbi:MAG: HAD family hydrolase [Planctomycetota bacterium]|nr:MAG: HAD family hydrolase [Planctomycetota bacterium]